MMNSAPLHWAGLVGGRVPRGRGFVEGILGAFRGVQQIAREGRRRFWRATGCQCARKFHAERQVR